MQGQKLPCSAMTRTFAISWMNKAKIIVQRCAGDLAEVPAASAWMSEQLVGRPVDTCTQVARWHSNGTRGVCKGDWTRTYEALSTRNSSCTMPERDSERVHRTWSHLYDATMQIAGGGTVAITAGMYRMVNS